MSCVSGSFYLVMAAMCAAATTGEPKTEVVNQAIRGRHQRHGLPAALGWQGIAGIAPRAGAWSGAGSKSERYHNGV